MNLNYKVVYTDSAIDDLNSILSYLSGYGNPNILTYFKKEIDNKLEIIKNFPQSYRVIFRQHGYDYRKMIVRNYIFVYYIDEVKNELVIFRIFHELEDYQNKLSDSKSEV